MTTIAALAMAAELAACVAAVVHRHQPDPHNRIDEVASCVCCSQLAGRLIPWPCPDRVVCGRIYPDHSNRLLPDGGGQR